MIELSLLKAFSYRNNLELYRHLVNTKSLSTQSILLLKDYDVYFEKNDDKKQIDFNVFSTFFFVERHPYMDEKQKEEFKYIITKLSNIEYKEEINETIKAFEQQEFYAQLSNLIEKNTSIVTVREEIERFSEKTEETSRTGILEEMDLDKALCSTDRSKGLKWRCKALDDHFQGGGLIKGDFGIIAAPVDAGKTSFCASEGSFMAEQCLDDEYVLWLSNEGDWQSILPRAYSASLNCNNHMLVTNKDAAIRKYTEKMHGNKNRLQIVDIQGWSTRDIEAVIKKKTPKLLIIDLLDHVIGFEAYLNKENSTERYNKLYQWGREIATKYCPTLAVSQMNREGNDNMYPAMTSLRGSGVDKQAAATFMLFIGSLEGDPTNRYFSMPKNKINSNKGWRAQVHFDPNKSRFL